MSVLALEVFLFLFLFVVCFSTSWSALLVLVRFARLKLAKNAIFSIKGPYCCECLCCFARSNTKTDGHCACCYCEEWELRGGV